MRRLLIAAFLLAFMSCGFADALPNDDWTYVGYAKDKDASYWGYFVKEDSLQANPKEADEKAIFMDDINSKSHVRNRFVIFFDCSNGMYQMDILKLTKGKVVQVVQIRPKKVTGDSIIAEIQKFSCRDIINT